MSPLPPSRTTSDVVSCASSSVTVKRSNMEKATPLKRPSPLARSTQSTLSHPEDEDDAGRGYETLAVVPVVHRNDTASTERKLVQESFLLRSLLAVSPLILQRVLRGTTLAGTVAADLSAQWPLADEATLRHVSTAYWTHLQASRSSGGTSGHTVSRWFGPCWRPSHRGYETALSSVSGSHDGADEARDCVATRTTSSDSPVPHRLVRTVHHPLVASTSGNAKDGTISVAQK